MTNKYGRFGKNDSYGSLDSVRSPIAGAISCGIMSLATVPKAHVTADESDLAEFGLSGVEESFVRFASRFFSSRSTTGTGGCRRSCYARRAVGMFLMPKK
jgi:hypothetical protein